MRTAPRQRARANRTAAQAARLISWPLSGALLASLLVAGPPATAAPEPVGASDAGASDSDAARLESPPPTSGDLETATSVLESGGEGTLSASVNEPLDATGTALEIVDVGSGEVVSTCTSGTTCEDSVSLGAEDEKLFEARTDRGAVSFDLDLCGGPPVAQVWELSPSG